MNHSNAFIQLCKDIQSNIKEISSNEAEQIIREKTCLLIDVRDQDEFEAGHIEGATHLSKGWIEAKIHNLVNDLNDTIILYCGGGNRSMLAADNLQKMGYTNVYSVAGGYKGWSK